MTRRRLFGLAGTGALVLALAWRLLLLRDRPPPLPADLAGTLYFVSDREGTDALFARRLPKGETHRLAVTGEPVADPALSPDGSRLAFAMGGRIGLLPLPRGEVRFATLGVDHRDAQPAWRPDGRALVVSSREPGRDAADLVLLDIETPRTASRCARRSPAPAGWTRRARASPPTGVTWCSCARTASSAWPSPTAEPSG